MKLLRLVRGHGRPLVWLHGFPDHPPTAEPLFTALAGRQVIAPWLRGYAPSPLGGPFDLETLAHDVIELLEELGEPVDLVGHDWGAVITYAVCALAPERVRRAATLAVPHPLTMLRALRSPAQLRRSWYMLLFQLPGAERLVRARDLALIRRLWRSWSPGFTLDDARRTELEACLAASLPARSLLRAWARVSGPASSGGCSPARSRHRSSSCTAPTTVASCRRTQAMRTGSFTASSRCSRAWGTSFTSSALTRSRLA